MNVLPLFEGTYTVDDSKTFLPFDPSKDSLENRPASLLVDIVPFMIRTTNELVIIDPGLGLQDKNGEFQIHENIRKHGFTPEDVSIVLLSHLHKDHANGICYGRDSAFNLMFPKAGYFCQEKEMEYAFTKTSSPSFDFDKLKFLQQSPQLKLLNGTGSLDEEIQYEVSGGHTPYHQVFMINTSDMKYFFGGDIVPQPSQVIRKFIAKYDFDGKLSAQRRNEYARRGAEEGWQFLFFHDGKMPVGKVTSSAKGFSVQKP